MRTIRVLGLRCEQDVVSGTASMFDTPQIPTSYPYTVKLMLRKLSDLYYPNCGCTIVERYVARELGNMQM